MTIQNSLRKHQVFVSVIFLIIGTYLFLLGLFGTVLSDLSPDVINDLNSYIGNWTYWFLVLGGLLLLVCIWYLIDRYRKLKEFNELMDSPSKSKFIKNIARIENLAISLGPDYEERVMEKEDEYNIDR